MKLQFSAQAEKDLLVLETKDQSFILEKLELLIKCDNFLSHPKVKKLKTIPFFRYRVGNFRIFLDAEGFVLTVIRIKRRNEKTYK